MLSDETLSLLRCPTCGEGSLIPVRADGSALRCGACGFRYLERDGIFDLTPRRKEVKQHPYRTELLYDMIAPLFDASAPALSALVWGCEPMRYVDWAHRLYGQAQGGRALAIPLGTGLLPAHVRGAHATWELFGVDASWRMLRTAQARFQHAGGAQPTLFRAVAHALPFRDGTFQATVSFNGLNGFLVRDRAITELRRVTSPGGVIGGSAIAREERPVADRLLDRYEQIGVYPTPRTLAYLVKELEEKFRFGEFDHESHGAILFWLGRPVAR